MVERMLIDATHPEETRVAVVNGNRLEEFDYEATHKRQLKGNIYLAKVTRVEPSLQAAFVDYGENRHGFLAFNEIHPDYYRIPIADRKSLEDDTFPSETDEESLAETSGAVEEVAGDEIEEVRKNRPALKRTYKIQEVVKRNQILLVQIVKEERGNKGAALTTYLSLAGRYCVLMPNTSRGGGVSRKISSSQDRARLKNILADMPLPKGMGVIVRTAGAKRSKLEIKRDFDYISKLWDGIRQLTLKSIAPCLIHEEANLIKRSIRDMYSKAMEEVLVAGDEAYRTAKNFMKTLTPSHAKKVQPFKDASGIPLFQRYQIESQLNAIYDPIVQLRSGGSIVINQTEALVAIDVNSGKATKERHIEETAVKTNLEALEEVARQIRLRDLAGLVVIDFIDMEDNHNEIHVERKLKEALRRDRARIQLGRISPFGLLEMSRQRLRPSLLESLTQQCPHCGGTGYIQSTETAALKALRALEEDSFKKNATKLTLSVSTDVAIYILNHKRDMLKTIEEHSAKRIHIETSRDFMPSQYSITADDMSETQPDAQSDQRNNAKQSVNKNEERGRKRQRNRTQKTETGAVNTKNDAKKTDLESPEEETNFSDNQTGMNDGENTKRRRRRNRRGGRRRNRAYQDIDAPKNIADIGEENHAITDMAEENLSQDTQSASGVDNPANSDGPIPSPSMAADPAPNPDIVTNEIADPSPSLPPEQSDADALATKKSRARKSSSKKGTAKKVAAKKTAKKASAKKASAKKASAKKANAKKASAKKATAKKAAGKKVIGNKVVTEKTPSETINPDSVAPDKTSKVTPIAEKPQVEPQQSALIGTTSNSTAEIPQTEVKKRRRFGWWMRR